MLKLIYKTVLARIIKQIEGELSIAPFREPELDEMYQYAVRGGRRSRALLVLMGCKAVGGATTEAMPMAVAMELAHKASLIVDDVADQDHVRRGRPTFHARYGLRKAVVMADLLVSRAYQQLERLNQIQEPQEVVECYRLFSDTYYTVCLGEIEELLRSADIAMSEEAALKIAYRKSGLTLENCLRAGGALGQGKPAEISAMANYGHSLGLAFQLINDLNNLNGVEELVGRHTGSDLLVSRTTFLVAYALRHAASPNDRSRLAALLDCGKMSAGEVDEAAQLIRRSGADTAARERIEALLEEARDCLQPLRHSAVKSLMIKATNDAYDQWLWIGTE